ncbi:MAG TPA: hypothetical protein VGJ57_11875 [Nitrospirales bacterium]
MRSPDYTEWLIRASNLEARRVLADGLGLHPITAEVALAEGVRLRLKDVRLRRHGEVARC